jgi:RHS repeat-associated protein
MGDSDAHDRIAYSPYGEATRTLRSDVNGDGFVNQSDYTGIIRPRNGATIGTANYIVEADLDRNGVINQLDYDICIADDGKSSSGGVGEAGLFSRGVRNSIGYCGYVFNEDSGLYTVRFRTYSPTLGRWLERDPAGYVDGMGLYEYVRGGPIAAVDPRGLWTDEQLEARYSRRETPASAREPPLRPGEVRSRFCSQPSCRDLVFDFESDPDHPSPAGTIEIDTWAELVEELERRIAEGTAGKCWTVAGHGWGGTFSPEGDGQGAVQEIGRTTLTLDMHNIKFYRDSLRLESWCRSKSSNDRGREELKESKAMLRFLELARKHLSDGGILEFGGCESGAGKDGHLFGKALAREMPGVRVLLYDRKITWSVRWFQSPRWRSVGIGGFTAFPIEYFCERECKK